MNTRAKRRTAASRQPVLYAGVRPPDCRRRSRYAPLPRRSIARSNVTRAQEVWVRRGSLCHDHENGSRVTEHIHVGLRRHLRSKNCTADAGRVSNLVRHTDGAEHPTCTAAKDLRNPLQVDQPVALSHFSSRPRVWITRGPPQPIPCGPVILVISVHVKHVIRRLASRRSHEKFAGASLVDRACTSSVAPQISSSDPR